MRILVGDIGGTNTRLAVFDGDARGWTRTLDRRFESQRHPALEPLVEAIAKDAAPIDAAAFGVAGPVHQTGATVTNLRWVIDRARLREAARCEHAVLLNDFEAIARSLSTLEGAALRSLTPTLEPSGDVRAVLGAGTGLGVAILPGDRVVATEGGHADFGPRDDFEDRLARHVRAREGRCSVEHLLSGPGIARIYDFVIDAGLATISTAFATRLAASEDRAATISGARGDEPACALAVDRFVAIYGSESANVALRCVPSAGLYIAGGIAPRLIDRIEAGSFMDSFLDKPPMRALLGRIPVFVVMDPDAGLLGCRAIAIAALNES